MGAVTVNGTTYEVVDSERRLIDFLRDDLKLFGTKEGCGIGRCGACTVLVEGQPRRACRTKVVQVLERKILTIEGLGAEERLHPIQQAFVQTGAIRGRVVFRDGQINESMRKGIYLRRRKSDLSKC